MEADMSYSWAWGAEPDEWIETDWIDKDGNYHDVAELGGLKKIEGKYHNSDDMPF